MKKQEISFIFYHYELKEKQEIKQAVDLPFNETLIHKIGGLVEELIIDGQKICFSKFLGQINTKFLFQNENSYENLILKQIHIQEQLNLFLLEGILIIKIIIVDKFRIRIILQSRQKRIHSKMPLFLLNAKGLSKTDCISCEVSYYRFLQNNQCECQYKKIDIVLECNSNRYDI